MQKDDLIIKELEILTGSLIEGDCTPLVFKLLEDTHDLKSLCTYLNIDIQEYENEPEDTKRELPSFMELFNSSPRVEDL